MLIKDKKCELQRIISYEEVRIELDADSAAVYRFTHVFGIYVYLPLLNI